MRNFLAVLGGGAGAVGVVGVTSVLVAAGFYIQQGRNAAQATDQVAATLALPQTAPAPAAPELPDIEEAVEIPLAAPEIMTSAPAFDEVRREADGMTVIAGRGAPGAVVSVLQNGVEIATSKVDRSGKFATLAIIPPDGLGHSLTLSQETAEGPQNSDGEILLAPLVAPVVVAQITEPAIDGVPVEQAADVPGASAQETPPQAVAQAAAAIETAQVQGEVAPVDVQSPQTSANTAAEPSADKNEGAEAIEESTVLAAAPQETGEGATARATKSLGSEETDTATKAETQAEVAQASEPKPDTSMAADAGPSPSDGIVMDIVEVDRNAAAQESTQEQTLSADIAPEEQVVAALDPAPRAPRPPAAILRSTAAGIELLNPVIPEVMDNVAIDTISYSDSGEVQLAGRAQTNAVSVRVYLDNKSVVVLAVDAEGRWRGDVPDVDEGIYTLRVDEVSGTGKISSRVETPFKREPLEVLAAAAAQQGGPITAITVQSGATLWAIARDRYGAGELYVRVFEANKDAIRDPDLIYPGQIFELPE